MTTHDLIKRLRNLGPLGKIMEELVIVAADRLEELQRELSESIRERNKTVADLIKQRDDALKNQQPTTVAQQLTTRPEPSRLEISAMLKSGWFANSEAEIKDDQDPKWWIEQADALIAAAKEGK